jgi:predicted PurR-regulated permease PerM
MWNLIISTIVFLIAANYLHCYLEKHGLPKGMTRGILVFVIASFFSWSSGEMVDWTKEKIEGPQPITQTPNDLSQLLKLID